MKEAKHGLTAEAILGLLTEGNRRFASGQSSAKVPNRDDLTEMAKGPKPIAAIICCSDPRVCPEIVLDQPLGKLFVIRNAGNAIEGDTLASLEIACAKLGINTIMVMGHTGCSAVMTSLGSNDSRRGFLNEMSRLGRKILRGNKMFYRKKRGGSGDGYTVDLGEAVEYNVLYGVREVLKNKYFSALHKRGRLKVIGAVYNILEGQVHLLDQSDAESDH